MYVKQIAAPKGWERRTRSPSAVGPGLLLPVMWGLIALQGSAQAAPLRELPDLESITFFERTSACYQYTFLMDSDELMNRRPTLSWSSCDFDGADTEYYDVFYSDASGNFDVDGEYLTIEAVFSHELPAGGGLNIGEARLNFGDGTNRFAVLVTHFRALGDNAHPETAGNAADGDLQTYTTLGNTVGQTERLSLTLDFFPGEIPTVTEWGLVVMTLLLLTGLKVGFGRRRAGKV